jgi:hypothetical protein
MKMRCYSCYKTVEGVEGGDCPLCGNDTLRDPTRSHIPIWIRKCRKSIIQVECAICERFGSPEVCRSETECPGLDFHTFSEKPYPLGHRLPTGELCVGQEWDGHRWKLSWKHADGPNGWNSEIYPVLANE